jgi:hypothetical protein
MRPWITIKEPTQEDVRTAWAGVTLTWLEEIRLFNDAETICFLSCLATADGFDSAPEDLRLWYDKHIENHEPKRNL